MRPLHPRFSRAASDGTPGRRVRLGVLGGVPWGRTSATRCVVNEREGASGVRADCLSLSPLRACVLEFDGRKGVGGWTVHVRCRLTDPTCPCDFRPKEEAVRSVRDS